MAPKLHYIRNDDYQFMLSLEDNNDHLRLDLHLSIKVNANGGTGRRGAIIRLREDEELSEQERREKGKA